MATTPPISSSAPPGASPPTLPFHVAKAYGAPAPTQARATTTPPSTEPIARIAPTRTADDVTLAKPNAEVSRLVAGQVETPAIETGPANHGAALQDLASSTGGIPFYRHPADQNTAATELNLGRSIDVSG